MTEAFKTSREDESGIAGHVQTYTVVPSGPKALHILEKQDREGCRMYGQGQILKSARMFKAYRSPLKNT